MFLPMNLVPLSIARIEPEQPADRGTAVRALLAGQGIEAAVSTIHHEMTTTQT